MIERDGPLSLSRQCALLAVSRSSRYYRPKGESAENLALMRRMDELHMAYPFYGSRQLMRHLRREGATAGRHRIRRLMRLMGVEATYRRPRTSVASPEHRVFPYLPRGLAISRADRVLGAGVAFSMDGRGRFLDNIFIERLWRSLKYEAVYLYEIRDGLDAERIIGSWFDFYNEVRPHSSLGGRTPGDAYRNGTGAV